MATIIFNNQFTTGVSPNTKTRYIQYKTDSGSWSSDDTINTHTTATPTSSLSLRAHESGSAGYETFTLCFNMDSPNTTNKGASVDVGYDPSCNPYCTLSNFSPSDTNFSVTIKA